MPNVSDVWIIGDSYIHWAERRAWIRHLSNDLGVAAVERIKWDGTRGMRWAQLRQRLQHLALFNPAPKVILLHVGGNDLGLTKGVVLRRAIKDDIQSISEMYPNVKLIVSGLVPRMAWPRSEWPVPKVEKVRKYVNNFTRRLVAHAGGMFIQHADITPETPGFYFRDGVHLSDIGTDLFLFNIKEALTSCLS